MKPCIRLTLFILALLLISNNALAQKIQIKKDFLYIDKKKTPITIDIKHKTMKNMGDFHQIYTFTDASSDSVFLYVDYQGYMIPGINGKLSWMEISDANRSKTNSVDFEGGLFSSTKKIVLFLLNEHQFFNHEGVVNHQKINEFLASNTHSVVKEQAAKELGKTAGLREFNPHISPDLSIRKGGLHGDVIGRVSPPKNHDPSGPLIFRVYDLDENPIAIARTQPNSPTVRVAVKVSPDDEIRFDYRSRFGLGMEIGGKEFLEELIEQIFLKGYYLEHQYNEVNNISDTETNLTN